MKSLLIGDCIASLKTLPSQSVHTCVTSPPYFGLRDYGVEGQIGLEATPDAYVARLVEVFREVRRVLRDDGTLWLNLGDSYAATRGYQVPSTKGGPKHGPAQAADCRPSKVPDGLKPKDLIGIPWRVAFALQQDGWYLRQAVLDDIQGPPAKNPDQVFWAMTNALVIMEKVMIAQFGLANDPVIPHKNPRVNVIKSLSDPYNVPLHQYLAEKAPQIGGLS